MEVQMAAQVAKPTGRATPPHHHAAAGGKPVPGYLRPPAGSCHHVCKYGGAHAFEDKETPTVGKKKPGHSSKPRKQQQPAAAAAPAPAPAPESQSGRVMGKVRSVFRRRVGDSSREADKAAKGNKGGGGGVESVEWKDIVTYDTTTVTTPVIGSGDAKKKDVVVKGNTKSHDKPSKGVQAQDETLDKKSAKPPKGKKPTTSLLVTEKMAIDPELLLHGYQVLSPSLIQSRATLLRDLEEEMVHEAIITKEEKPKYTLDEEEEYIAAAAAETSRPIPAHRRAKSMSISSRSVRYPFIRQASKNSSAGAFKLRSRSTKAPMAPPPEEETTKKPARLRSRRGSEDASSGSATGRGIQLRIRSLRRRGVGGGSGGAGTGFVVPAVALRYQKTLEKKKSQRLYNGVIEETASKLVKTRKSRVKALVGAFESVISKIAK
ncbi:unnamed protein product [Urochloa decumbens]|uniref:Calmodulin-binding domain-containing protein n=1 Tax=Urochloa decumbens TaxID=240449 RepID=A0ABC8WAZ9_9POAL